MIPIEAYPAYPVDSIELKQKERMDKGDWSKLLADIRNSGLSVDEARWRWDTQPDLAEVYVSFVDLVVSLGAEE